jgi:hypothetical protein
MTSYSSRYALIFKKRKERESLHKYRVATGMAMTVRMIMILLYGAGGEPGRGEIPMMRFSKLYPICFP